MGVMYAGEMCDIISSPSLVEEIPAMWRCSLLVAALGLALCPVAGLAQSVASTDLWKIDRSLRKEPAYKNTPKYCLLVFGPKADFRVWLVQDGDLLYVDRNGNGDLTEPGEQVKVKDPAAVVRQFTAGSVSDGKLTHTELMVSRFRTNERSILDAREWKRVNSQKDGPWVWSVGVQAERPAGDERKLPRRIGYIINGDQEGQLLFADRPDKAPIVHLNGPWTLGLQDYRGRLTAGRKSELQIGVGTPGVGPGTFAFVLYKDTIPETAWPRADIVFPGRRKGDEPIKRSYTLKERC
jgi:hypothetical protein